MTFAVDDVDTSSYQMAFMGFTSSWGGWNAIVADNGVLELTTTVQDIMDANGITDISEFGGIVFQLWNADCDITYDYTVAINGEVVSEGTEVSLKEDYTVLDEDGNFVQFYNKAAFDWASIEFAVDDEISATIAVHVEDTDEEETTKNDSNENDAEPEETTTDASNESDAEPEETTTDASNGNDAESEETTKSDASGNDAEPEETTTEEPGVNDTEPEETQPTETEPEETVPEETQPAETEPEEETTSAEKETTSAEKETTSAEKETTSAEKETTSAEKETTAEVKETESAAEETVAASEESGATEEVPTTTVEEEKNIETPDDSIYADPDRKGTVVMGDVEIADVTGDGNVDLKDVVALKRFVACWNVTVYFKGADVDQDNKITLRDLAILKRFVTGWNVDIYLRNTSL